MLPGKEFIMKFLESVRLCPFCRQQGKQTLSIVTLFGDEVDGFTQHYLFGKHIQDAMPNTPAAVREFMRMTNNPRMEGYCSTHMEELFGQTSPRIKDFTDAAMEVGECLEIDNFDNFIESEEEYYQLQAELQELSRLYEQSGSDRYCKAERIGYVPSDADVVCRTEHLALYVPTDSDLGFLRVREGGCDA